MALLSVALIFVFLFHGIHSATLSFTNRCSFPVWPTTLHGGGEQLNTGFYLAGGGGNTSINVPSSFSSFLIWGRTECKNDPSGRFSCGFGDCDSGQVECGGKGGKPPLTQVEFTFTQNDGDTYDISLVNGYNVEVTVTPQGGIGGTCSEISCNGLRGNACPPELVVRGPNNDVLACESACDKFKEPKFCCTGSFEPRGACQPSTFSQAFKRQCPQAYSFAHDDPSSTFNCRSGTNYEITFC